MSGGIYLIFTVLIASSCRAVNHGNGNDINGQNPVDPNLFKLRTAASTPWGERCDVEGEVLAGTCMRKHECLAAGGKLNGKCGVLGYCCTDEIKEYETTQLKHVTISRPRTLSSPISYYIKARSNLVCQLRIEFERLVLAEPSLQDNHPQCWADSFQVDDIRLCGINNGQHIYVPFNASIGATSKELRFSLASRGINPSLVDPDWKIIVTQLECPNSAQRVILRQKKSITGKIINTAAVEEVVLDSDREPRTLGEQIPSGDSYWIAPVGCLQYFPNPSGVIESFNFNNGNGVYLGNMKYSICFRKTASDQQLILTANTFELGSGPTTQTNEGYDDLCYTNIMSPGRSEDYLFIPEGIRQSFPNVRATRFCGRSIDGVTVISNMPGPFAIHFNSDTYYDSNRTEVGFRLTYQIS